MGTRTTRTRVDRRIAADPTSTALLLAGPAALELWPGVRRVGRAGRRALVQAPLPGEDRSTPATVRALPPHRTPTSYVTRFGFSGPALPGTRGEVRLSAAPVRDGLPQTQAEVVLDSEDLEDSALDAAALREQAEAFLANLAAAAEARSRAA